MKNVSNSISLCDLSVGTCEGGVIGSEGPMSFRDGFVGALVRISPSGEIGKGQNVPAS